MKRLAEILKRISEIETEVRAGNVSDALSKELDDLLAEKAEIERKQKEFENRFTTGKKVNLPGTGDEPTDIRSSELYRTAWLKNLQGRKLSPEEFKVLEEQRAITSADGSGGDAIPTSTYSKIQDALVQLSILYPRVQKMFVKGLLSLPLEDSTSDAAWVAEGAGANDGTDKLKNATFQAYDLIKNQDITAQMATMSIVDFEAWLVRVMARKMAQALDAAIINGTGALNNQPEGILTGTSWVDNTNAIKIVKDQAWTADNIISFIGLLPTVYTPGAVIIVNRKTLYNKINTIKKATGSNEPLFVASPENGSIGKILGVPVLVFDAMPDKTVLYGDLDSFVYNFNKDVEISKNESIGFKSAKIAFRAHALVDGKLIRSDAFVKLYEAA